MLYSRYRGTTPMRTCLAATLASLLAVAVTAWAIVLPARLHARIDQPVAQVFDDAPRVRAEDFSKNTGLSARHSWREDGTQLAIASLTEGGSPWERLLQQSAPDTSTTKHHRLGYLALRVVNCIPGKGGLNWHAWRDRLPVRLQMPASNTSSGTTTSQVSTLKAVPVCAASEFSRSQATTRANPLWQTCRCDRPAGLQNSDRTSLP